MISPDVLANPKYSVLYVPIISFLYLWSIPNPEKFTMFSEWVPPSNEVYPILAGIAFLGAILAQNFFEAIFGPGGPGQDPKYTSTALKHSFAIAMGVEADEIPGEEIESYRQAISEISRKIPIRKAVRGILVMAPVYVLRLLMLYSILLLGLYLWRGEGDILLILLLLATSTIFIEKYVSKLFPDTGNPESAKFLDVPEYKRYQENVSDD